MASKKKREDGNTQGGSESAAPAAAQEEGEMTSTDAAPTEEGGPSFEDELNAARAIADKNWDLYLRSQAELDNYRKRVQREKEDLARFANEGILREILPVVDNLERAVEHAGSEEGTGGLMQGVEMTLGQFKKVLEKFGVTPVASMGELFNPAMHEAIGQLESSKHPPNTVVQELQKGYLLNDRLLRPAMVMVSKAPASPSE